jgi:RNA polymerase sigma-70 factor (ECF subfamily)
MPMDEVTRGLLNRSMAALADGDRRAFDAVYGTLWPVLNRFVAAMSADPMIAEDIAQQSMLKVLTRVATFDPSMDAVAWSMAIAVNEYRSYRRKLSNRAGGDSERAWPDAIDADTPEADAIRTDLTNAARAVLSELRAQDREVVIAAIYEAQRPRLTAAAFRKRLQRALAASRLIWKKRYGDDRTS